MALPLRVASGIWLTVLAACGRAPAVDTRAEPEPATSVAIAAAPVDAASAPVAQRPTPPPAPPRDPSCPPSWSCDYAAFAEPSRRPTVTSLLVQKARHQLHLVAGRTIVRSYGVALGSGGLGQKTYEGDRITPISTYKITGRYPSKWHTYLAIDYPAEIDKERHAEAVKRGEVPEGRGPGSAIAIHGHRADQPARLHKAFDWTLGCVSLDNDEIDEVASVVAIGTPVTIEP